MYTRWVRESISGREEEKNIEFKVIIAAVSQLVVTLSFSRCVYNIFLFSNLLLIRSRKKYSQAITFISLTSSLSLTPVYNTHMNMLAHRLLAESEAERWIFVWQCDSVPQLLRRWNLVFKIVLQKNSFESALIKENIKRNFCGKKYLTKKKRWRIFSGKKKMK